MSFLNIYQGKPCKKCGSTERYTSDKRCVACRHARNAAAWKKEIGERQEKANTFDSLSIEEKREFLKAEFARKQRQSELYHLRKLEKLERGEVDKTKSQSAN